MFKNIDMKTDYMRRLPLPWRAMSRVFVALGDEHRQRILLTFEPGERLNVSQIAAVSTLARPTVSHHLRILREAGILRSEKIGKEIYFWLDKAYLDKVLADVLEYLREHA
jgi:DNA-binding transcriptional ArsR family regulator